MIFSEKSKIKKRSKNLKKILRFNNIFENLVENTYKILNYFYRSRNSLRFFSVINKPKSFFC